MKRKTLTLCLSLLACISLIGVGFAAWVISGGDSQEASGNITVDTVTDGRFTIEKPTISEKIYYGMDLQAEASDSTPWLNNNNKSADEKLEITFDVTVVAKSVITLAEGVENTDQNKKAAWEAAAEVTASINAIESAAWLTAKEANVVADPIVSVALKEVTSSADGITGATYTVTVTAKWGDTFKVGDVNVNPYVFYNDGIKDVNNAEGLTTTNDIKTWGDHAAHYLGLVEALANTSYTVKISVTAK